MIYEPHRKYLEAMLSGKSVMYRYVDDVCPDEWQPLIRTSPAMNSTALQFLFTGIQSEGCEVELKIQGEE